MTNSSRYRKQILFHGIGEEGQQALNESRILLVGCGALGCVLADAMTRAGIGHIRIVDRDFVEFSNLQRQMLYTEQDAKERLPKAVAAAERLKQVNSTIEIDACVADVDFTNIQSFAEGADLILDGSDNFEVRYLINDLSLETGIPWIFTGCTGSHGQMMPIFPGVTGCLRCLIPHAPPPGSTETCDTAGVLGPAIYSIAALQAATAIRILCNKATDTPVHSRGVPLKLTMLDVWDLSMRQVDVSSLRESGSCPACHNGERAWLKGEKSSGSAVLCGRNAVQISPADKIAVSLEDLATRLASSGTVTSNPFLMRIDIDNSEFELTVFQDGRAIIQGTEDPAIARAVYSRYIGS